MILLKQVRLKDDGIGTDVSRNDGIYTAAFTQFTTNGRYSVSAQVSSVPTTRVRTERSYFAYSSKIVKIQSNDTSKSEFNADDFESSFGDPEEDIESEPVEEFTREDEMGSFKLENFTPDNDLIPPGRVIDLQAISADDEQMIVELQWTVAGDDEFYGEI